MSASSANTPTSRRLWLGLLTAVGLGSRSEAPLAQATPVTATPAPAGTALPTTDAEWRARLTPQQYQVLRQAGTERAGTSPLNNEKRKGRYLCVGCDNPLFTSEMKFDSGTGWPSFFTSLPGAFKTSTDFKLVYPRTEYHCARCGGHHGHVFKDGPRPTGERWCNNGVVLKFEVAA